MDVEQTTVIRAGLDPSQFVAGSDQLATSVEDAGARIIAANDQVTQSITKVTLSQVDSGKGFERLSAQLDPSIAALQRYQTATDKLNGYMAAGRIQATATGSAQDEYNRLLDLARARYQSVTQAAGEFGQATEKVGQSSRATTMLLREVTRGYVEMSAGMSPLAIAAMNFGNIEHAVGRFGGVVKEAIAFITSPVGLILAAGAAILALGASAESSERGMLGLQTALRGTRDDYVAMAAEAKAAAHEVAAGVITLVDATAAAKSFAANKAFQGTQAQLQDLITTANDLAIVMGVTLPAEAVKMAAAMNDPGKMADELANVHFKGMNSELARSITLQAESGDKAGAYARLLDVVKASTTGAAQESKTKLQTAMEDLKGAFIGTGEGGDSFAKTLGTAFDNVAVQIVNGVTNILNAIAKAGDWINSHGYGLGASTGTGALGFDPSTGLNTIPYATGTLGTVSSSYGPTGQPPGSISTSSTAAAAYDVSKMDQIVYSFVQQGTALNDAIALAANAMRESSGNFNAVNMADAPGGSHGLFMWNNGSNNNTTNGRLAGFQAQNGGLLPEQTSIAAQVAYALTELSTSKAGIYGQVLAANDVGTKAALITSGFEVPKDIPGQSAISAGIAQNYLARSGTNGGTPVVISGNASIAITGGGLLGASAAQQGLLQPTTGPTGLTAAAAGTGVANDPNQVIQDALTASRAGSANDNAAHATALVKDYTTALKLLADQGITTGANVDQLKNAIDKQNAALTAAVAPVQGVINALEIQTKDNELLAAAYDKGSAAGADMQSQIKAETELRKAGGEPLANNILALSNLTAEYKKAKLAADDAALAQASNDNQRTIDYINAEISSLGDSADVRARNLAILKETQTLQKNEPFASEERKQAAINEAAAISDATVRLQEQQQALQTVGSMASGVFNTIGDQISQAFVSGQSAALTFGNITHAVLTQIIKDILQLAIIAPIMNAITGGSQTTLGSILGIGSTGTSTAAGGTSALSMLSTGGSLVSGGSSVMQALGYQGLGGQINGLLGGPGTSLFAGSGVGGIGSGVSGFLATPLGAAQYGPVTSGLASGGAGVGGATIGGALGGVGAGFTVGSLIGSGVQSLTNKTGPGPEIGAAAGASLMVAGAALAPETFGMSLLLAGLIGGSIGGAAGGLIGPGPASKYSGTQVGLSNGLLNVGQSWNQGYSSSGSTTQADVNTLNTYLQGTHGLTLTSIGNLGQVGSNGSGQIDPSKYPSLGAAFPQFGFGATNDNTLNTYLSGKSYPDLTTLQADIANYAALVTTTIPALTAQTKVTGSLNDATTLINTTFQSAIAAATSYGIATDTLTTSQKTATDAANAAATAAKAALTGPIAQRDVTAQATLSGSPAAVEAAALQQFDSQMQAQRDSLSTQLIAIFGDSYKTTTDFATQMAALEKTLGDERLTIVKQYNDLIIAAQKAIDQNVISMAGRFRTAAASISGNPADAQTTALYNFDANAQTQRDALTSQFKVIYGDAYVTQTDYANKVWDLETTLGEERLAIVKQYNDQVAAAAAAAASATAAAQKAVVDSNTSFIGRYMTAQATVSGNPADAKTAALFGFDTQAVTQEDALKAQFQTLYGASYSTATDYVAEMAQLEKTLGEERLAVAKQYDAQIVTVTADQARQTAAAAVASLTAYTQSLQTSSASPLSPTAQLALAHSQFNAVSGAASAGDLNSLQQLQTYANSFLGASRVVNGSGAAYANDFQAVLDALDKTAQISPDPLTASVLQAETRTQTQILVDNLTALRAAVDAITAQLKQNSAAPARIAA